MNTDQLFSVRDALTRSGSDLGKLNAAAKTIRFYDRLLDTVLDQPLRAHVAVANLRDGHLILQADSPVWASRLRLQLHEIRSVLDQRSTGPRLTGISLITRPNPSVGPVITPRRRLPISDTTRNLLNAVADDIDNPGLRRALQRIAQRKP